MENKKCVSCGMEYPNHKMSCKYPVKEYRLPTAESYIAKNITDYWEGGKAQYTKEDVEKAMIEFAKLHVEAALKAAEYSTEEYDFSVEIKNSYPLDKIK